jgi:hypothetical protein
MCGVQPPGAPSTPAVGASGGYRSRVAVVAGAAAAALLLIAVLSAAVHGSGTGRTDAGWHPAATPTVAPTTTSPSPSPSFPRWVVYPGQPYPLTREPCPDLLDENILVPALYTARHTKLEISDVDLDYERSDMICDVLFMTEPAQGSYKLKAWIFKDPARAGQFYEQHRAGLAGFPRSTKPPPVIGEVRGIGQRAYEVYRPSPVSDSPNVHIQPGRSVDLAILDANLVLDLTVFTSLPMNGSFSYPDQKYRDVIHKEARDVMARLRAGRPRD